MRREGRDGVRVIGKYIEYNAIVVLALVIGRANLRERRRGLSLKYRILRGMMGVVIRAKGGGIGR